MRGRITQTAIFTTSMDCRLRLSARTIGPSPAQPSDNPSSLFLAGNYTADRACPRPKQLLRIMRPQSVEIQKSFSLIPIHSDRHYVKHLLNPTHTLTVMR